MVDIFRCESIATSLSFSPTGDYLATAHVDNVGIFLWANRMQFTTVSLRSITEDDVIRVALPTSSTLEDETEGTYGYTFLFFVATILNDHILQTSNTLNRHINTYNSVQHVHDERGGFGFGAYN